MDTAVVIVDSNELKDDMQLDVAKGLRQAPVALLKRKAAPAQSPFQDLCTWTCPCVGPMSI